MADTPKEGETGNQESLENKGKNDTAPVGNSVDTAEVERFKKEAEQSRMRANQLENELKAKNKLEEEAEAGRLEKQNEFKALYEQTQAKLKAVEDEKETRVQQEQIGQESSKVLKDYPTEVVELAKDTEISLVDTSEEAIKSFKDKLDKINSKVVKSKKVLPNNPNTAPVNVQQNELLERVRSGDKEARFQVVSELPAVMEMRRQAGLTNQ